jgi:RNase H-like domain found in reverse transcriptase/Reverse transcriptase (RNA-dependent DNA polymerase)
MFFGLCNSPATFQRVMDHVFHPLKDKYPGMLFVYMDDILIVTPNDAALHEQIVHKVLELLEEESFFLKLTKCKFEHKSIEYLGIMVKEGTIHIDPTKSDGPKSWPRQLSMVKQVRSMLGVLGYQRPFIKGYAHLARPLTDLLKKEVPFKWTEECMKALNELIDIVTSDLVLYRPDYDKPFELEVDASQFTTGAILYQRNKKGRLCPVAYHSKTLSELERGYNIHDHELLALMRGLENWCHLLLGSEHQVTVYTDHANLKYYCQAHKINRQVACYLPCLAEYNFKLVYKPEVTNKADGLSRRPDYDDGREDNEDVVVLPDHLFIDAINFVNQEQAVLGAQKHHKSTL